MEIKKYVSISLKWSNTSNEIMKVFSAATCNKIWCITALVRNVYEVCVIVSALTLSN